MIRTFLHSLASTLFFLSSFTLFLKVSHTCEASHYFDHSANQCGFYMNYTKECFDFAFGYCQYSGCVEYDYEIAGRSGKCSKNGTITDTNWSSCTQACCDPAVSYPLNMDGINSCQSHVKVIVPHVIVIICTVAFVLILIFAIFTAFICFKQKYPNLRCPCAKNSSDIHPQFQYFSEISIFQKNSSLKLKSDHQWKQDEKQIQKAGFCVICLNERSNLMLQCRHVFHSTCFSEWMSRNKDKLICAICRREHECKDALKFFCVSCNDNFYEKNWDKVNRFNNITEVKCPSCRNIQ